MEKTDLLSFILGKHLWCEDFYLNFSGKNHLVFVFSTRKFWRLTFLFWVFPNMFTYSKIAPPDNNIWVLLCIGYLKSHFCFALQFNTRKLDKSKSLLWTTVFSHFCIPQKSSYKQRNCLILLICSQGNWNGVSYYYNEHLKRQNFGRQW